jgi:drug/metabolite transporter (DMT)-like permease
MPRSQIHREISTFIISKSMNPMPSKSSSSLFAISAALLWGFNYPIVKLVLRSVPENRFLLIRFSIGVLLLCLVLYRNGETLRVRREHVPRFLALGLLGVGIYNVMWTAGIHRTTAANAALLISSAPVFTAIYMVVSGQERLVPQRMFGILAAFLGIALITIWKPGAEVSLAGEAMLGNLLVLACAVIFSFYAIVARPLLRIYSPLKVTTLAMAAGLPVLVPYGLIGGSALAQTQSVPAIAAEFAYVILCGTVIAYVCWYRGVQGLGATRTVVFHYLVSIVSMTVGYLALGEPVTGWQLAGAGLVLAGLIVSQNEFHIGKERKVENVRGN